MNQNTSPRLLAPLFALVLALTATAIFIPTAIDERITAKFLREQTHGHGTVCAEAIALSVAKLPSSVGPDELKYRISELAIKDPLLARLVLTDLKGLVTFDSQEGLQGQCVGSESLSGDSRSEEAVAGDGSPIVRVTAPVFVNDEIAGMVRADYKLDAIVEHSALSTRTALFTALVLMPLGLYASWLLIRRFKASLARLADVAEQGALGNLTVRTGLAPSHELGGLINAMDRFLTRRGEDSKIAKERCDALEERIAVRTQALDDITKQLEDMKTNASQT